MLRRGGLAFVIVAFGAISLAFDGVRAEAIDPGTPGSVLTVGAEHNGVTAWTTADCEALGVCRHAPDWSCVGTEGEEEDFCNYGLVGDDPFEWGCFVPEPE